MYNNVKEYKPTDEDKAWLLNIMDELAEGGKLVTDLVVYKKQGNTLELVCVNPVLAEMGHSMFTVNIEVLRMKKVSEEVGVKFIDNRGDAWN